MSIGLGVATCIERDRNTKCHVHFNSKTSRTPYIIDPHALADTFYKAMSVCRTWGFEGTLMFKYMH